MGTRYGTRRHWATELGLTERSIRLHCRPVHYDSVTRAALYPEWDVLDLVARLRPRPGGRKSFGD